MNVQQFAALKVGDKIANDMSSSMGEVTEVTDAGVRVRWSQGDGTASGRAPVTFAYPVNSTAWWHWRLIDDGGPGAMREMPYGA